MQLRGACTVSACAGLVALLWPLLAAVPVMAEDAPGRPRLLLMDLRAQGVDEGTTRTIRDLILLELTRSKRYDVVGGEDLRQVLELQADRQAVGCEENSCLAEVAGALGAAQVLYGSVGTLGELTLVNLSLFDAAEVRAVRRVDLRLRSLEDLPAAMPGKLAELLDEPGLAHGDGVAAAAQPDATPRSAASTSNPETGGSSLLVPLALVSVGGAGLITGVVLGAVGYAVAYRPLEQNATEVRALEAQGPSTVREAASAQDDIDGLTTSLLLWSGGAVASALLGAGLVVAGTLMWPDEGSEVNP
ncbi:MAG: hypothetical protein ABIJ09_14305 [Pseudomonadota bacterium]